MEQVYAGIAVSDFADTGRSYCGGGAIVKKWIKFFAEGKYKFTANLGSNFDLFSKTFLKFCVENSLTELIVRSEN
jgi:hypothetical protein